MENPEKKVSKNKIVKAARESLRSKTGSQPSEREVAEMVRQMLRKKTGSAVSMEELKELGLTIEPPQGMQKGGVMKSRTMKAKGMVKGGAAMKTKGYAKGGAAMATKGAAKGGANNRKPAGPMRSPSSKKSGLYGR